MTELKPCPFCCEKPYVETKGTFIDINCCISLSFQKSDFFTHEQRKTWDELNLRYSEEAENIAFSEAANAWNHRPIEDALRARIKELEEAMMAIRGIVPQSYVSHGGELGQVTRSVCNIADKAMEQDND